MTSSFHQYHNHWKYHDNIEIILFLHDNYGYLRLLLYSEQKSKLENADDISWFFTRVGAERPLPAIS